MAIQAMLNIKDAGFIYYKICNPMPGKCGYGSQADTKFKPISNMWIMDFRKIIKTLGDENRCFLKTL